MAAARTADSCLMLDYVRVLNFFFFLLLLLLMPICVMHQAGQYMVLLKAIQTPSGCRLELYNDHRIRRENVSANMAAVRGR